MKIRRIETIPIRVPIKPELAIRSGRGGSHTASPFLIVKIHTDDGIIGLGEVSCTPRWSGEDQFSAAHFVTTYLAPLLQNEDPSDIESLTAKLRLGVAGNFFTKAGIEMALWDILGKSQGKPVYELLGGRVREFIPTKWSVSGVVPERAAEIATWAVKEGFAAMKVKVGIDHESDVARVKAVREAIGPKIKLGVDANGGWSKESALKTVEQLYPSNIYFAEQPLPPEEDAALADLRKQLRIPIIADESVYTLRDATVLARLQACDVFSIYVGKAGGIGPAKKIAAFAESAGLKCTVGSNLELGIGSAAMIHLAIATRGITAEEYPCDIIGPMFYQDDVVTEPLSIRPGEARVNDHHGLGVELDEDKIEKYRVR